MCALGRDPGEILAEDRFPTADPGATVTRVVEFFARHPKPKSVGVGSFGPVDLDPASPTWGYVTTTPKPGWRHVSVARAIQDRLAIPVRFETDVTAAAVGERRWGAGRGLPALCYLTVGTGIGAGLLLDGRPWHGLVHPEVGHMRIPRDRDSDPFPGSCPIHGDCWEGLAAGTAIAARWGVPPERLPDDHHAWRLEADYLALGILNIVLVASPQRVIVGGGVVQSRPLLELIRPTLRQLLAGYLDTPLLGDRIDSYLVLGELGDRAGVLGAIELAREGG